MLDADTAAIAPRRFIAYVRVSTEEQAGSGAGLAAQRAAILAEAERRGWAEVRFVEDAGFSGKDTRRPGLRMALEVLARRSVRSLARRALGQDALQGAPVHVEPPRGLGHVAAA